MITNEPPRAADVDINEMLARLHALLPMHQGLDEANTVDAELEVLRGIGRANLDKLEQLVLKGEHGSEFMPSVAGLARLRKRIENDVAGGIQRTNDWDRRLTPGPRGQTSFLQAWTKFQAGDKEALKPGHGAPMQPFRPKDGLGVWDATHRRWDPKPKPEVPPQAEPPAQPERGDPDE